MSVRPARPSDVAESTQKIMCLSESYLTGEARGKIKRKGCVSKKKMKKGVMRDLLLVQV